MQVARYAPIKYLKGMMRIELMGGPWWQTNHLIRQRLVVLDGKRRRVSTISQIPLRPMEDEPAPT
jgi:hypothetical protein